MVRSLNMEKCSLCQRKFMQGRQSFILGDDDSLKIETQSCGTKNIFYIELHTLDQKASEYKKTHYSGFGWSFIFFPMSAFMMYTGCSSSSEDMGVLLFLSLVFFVLGALGVVLFLKRSHHNIVYYNRFNGQPSVVIFKSKPDEETVSEFCATLSARISKSIDTEQGKTDKSTAQEVKEMANLMREGLISEEEFAELKKSILGLGKRPLGFNQA